MRHMIHGTGGNCNPVAGLGACLDSLNALAAWLLDQFAPGWHAMERHRRHFRTVNAADARGHLQGISRMLWHKAPRED